MKILLKMDYFLLDSKSFTSMWNKIMLWMYFLYYKWSLYWTVAVWPNGITTRACMCETPLRSWSVATNFNARDIYCAGPMIPRGWLWVTLWLTLACRASSELAESESWLSTSSFSAKSERSWLWGWAWGAESTVSVVDHEPIVSFPSRPGMLEQPQR